jgi:hypothetical protein
MLPFRRRGSRQSFRSASHAVRRHRTLPSNIHSCISTFAPPMDPLCLPVPSTAPASAVARETSHVLRRPCVFHDEKTVLRNPLTDRPVLPVPSRCLPSRPLINPTKPIRIPPSPTTRLGLSILTSLLLIDSQLLPVPLLHILQGPVNLVLLLLGKLGPCGLDVAQNSAGSVVGRVQNLDRLGGSSWGGGRAGESSTGRSHYSGRHHFGLVRRVTVRVGRPREDVCLLCEGSLSKAIHVITSTQFSLEKIGAAIGPGPIGAEPKDARAFLTTGANLAQWGLGAGRIAVVELAVLTVFECR